MVAVTMHQLSTTTDSDRFRARCHELQEYELMMLAELETDVAVAKRATRPFMGLIPRRGHLRFVLLAPHSQLWKQFDRCGYRLSALALDCDVINEELLRKLLFMLRLKTGIRTSNVATQTDGHETYLTYHVDLEAF
ncbi:hypothetical protein CL689_01405 [Candidatus Saccharibacteria bacterium]|nr:hypothetical protein [Candidatus Saccharibacteria bacterium]MBQ68707.1 hypothetical protein [Candidatus Saccharibacteria bacterium]